MSYFRANIDALAGYVPGEQPSTTKVIKLNTNENPYRESPTVDRAIQAALARGLQRYPDTKANAFRDAAAALYGVEREWLLCGNGSDDILTICTRAFVGQEQLIRLSYPSYIFYKTLAEIQGARAEEIHFQADWSLPDAFAAAAPDLRLAYLTNPNSPSGTVIPPARVLELAERLPCPLLVDEAYADFAETNCLELVHRSDKILITRTLSKSYALAGIRFGYVIAQPHVIAGLMKVKDPANCDALAIAAATAAINDQAWLNESRGKIIATRRRLTDAMRGLGFAAVESQANFVWCPHPSRPVKPLFDALRANQILVRYMDYPGWGDGLRISVGSDEQIDALLTVLRGLL